MGVDLSVLDVKEMDSIRATSFGTGANRPILVNRAGFVRGMYSQSSLFSTSSVEWIEFKKFVHD